MVKKSGIKSNKPRVIVIGLDGATFKNLGPWMKKGSLPNLKFLIDNGASGELESTIPPYSGPAWTSFMTGVNPGKHGIFGFVKPFVDKKYKINLVSSKDIKAKTIFEILSEQGKFSAVVNLPITYPPFKINGCMVSCGLTTPSKDFTFTYPENLFKKIQFDKSKYYLDVSPESYADNEKSKFFTDLIKNTEERKELSFKLMRKYDWDLFVLVFTGTDRVQHFYWHCIDPEHPKYNPVQAKKILPLIVQYYQKLDSVVGEFLKYMDADTSLIIMSDHGFGSMEKIVGFHEVLNQEGLSFYKDRSLRFVGVLFEFQRKIRGLLHEKSAVYRKTKNLLKTGSTKLKEILFKKDVYRRKLRKRLGGSDNYWQSINWRKTSAYVGISECMVNLNIKNREPEGIVSLNGEYEQNKKKIIHLMNQIYDFESKRWLSVKTYAKNEIYSGPYFYMAPDLFFEIENGRYILRKSTRRKEPIIESSKRTGGHRKEGISICYGNKFKGGYSIKNAQIMDIAPTILYLLGSTVPSYMDGKVLGNALRDGVLQSKPIYFENCSGERSEPLEKKEVYTDEERERVHKHLGDLGYL
ncbi:MAG: alkaline phosphatase family protein [Candidatus Omnitrophica bacterium]|nr:alkaline phosphatase family protein [Candidatus Omnitrophota bacterium]